MLKALKSGFSLLELALTLVVVSSIAVVALTKFTTQKTINNRTQAMDDLKRIREAIQNYVLTFGYYPCPASPTFGEYDATNYGNFGVGVRPSTVPSGATNAIGGCDTSNSRMPQAVSYTTFNNVAGANPRYGLSISGYASSPGYIKDTISSVDYRFIVDYDIYVGDPPCVDLGLPRDCMIDPKGNKYSYVVPAVLTSPMLCRYYMTAAGNSPKSYYFDNGAYPTTPKNDILNSDATYTNPTNLKVIKRYTDSGTTDGKVDYTSLNNEYTTSPYAYTDPQFLLIYFGDDGIGSYSSSGTKNTAISAGGGKFYNDSFFQEINHRNNIGYSDERGRYFFMPDKPVMPSTTLGGTVYRTPFDDIVMLGGYSPTTNITINSVSVSAPTYYVPATNMNYCGVCGVNSCATGTMTNRFFIWDQNPTVETSESPNDQTVSTSGTCTSLKNSNYPCAGSGVATPAAYQTPNWP